MRDAQSRGQELGLSDDEVAFYDALADNESAKEIMGDEQLRFLAQELVERVKQNVSIDWQVRGKRTGTDSGTGEESAEKVRLPARHASSRDRTCA